MNKRRMENISKVFQVGDSLAVTIPKRIVDKLKIKKGEDLRTFFEKLEE